MAQEYYARPESDCVPDATIGVGEMTAPFRRFDSFYLQTPPRQVSASSCFFVNPFNVYYISIETALIYIEWESCLLYTS